MAIVGDEKWKDDALAFTAKDFVQRPSSSFQSPRSNEALTRVTSLKRCVWLRRWGISESRLPPNSIVRFRQPSVWEQYSWYILGALIIICLQSTMIVDLLLQRRRRRQIQAEHDCSLLGRTECSMTIEF